MHFFEKQIRLAFEPFNLIDDVLIGAGVECTREILDTSCGTFDLQKYANHFSWAIVLGDRSDDAVRGFGAEEYTEHQLGLTVELDWYAPDGGDNLSFELSLWHNPLHLRCWVVEIHRSSSEKIDPAAIEFFRAAGIDFEGELNFTAKIEDGKVKEMIKALVRVTHEKPSWLFTL